MRRDERIRDRVSSLVGRALDKLVAQPLALVVVGQPPFAGYKRSLVSTFADPARRGPLGRVLYPRVFDGWLARDYWPETDPAERERLKALAMSGESGRVWAAAYASHALDPQASRLLPAVLTMAREIEAGVILQVGASSGREIAWVARSLPDVVCIGTDVYAEVVEFAQEAHCEPNLEFRCAAAEELVEQAGQLLPDVPMVVFSSGALQYVQPEYLPGVFSWLAARRAGVVISETVSNRTCEPLEIEVSVPRGSFAWTHPFGKLAERAGLEVVELRVDYPYVDEPARRDTGNLFLRARPRRDRFV